MCKTKSIHNNKISSHNVLSVRNTQLYREARITYFYNENAHFYYDVSDSNQFL